MPNWILKTDYQILLMPKFYFDLIWYKQDEVLPKIRKNQNIKITHYVNKNSILYMTKENSFQIEVQLYKEHRKHHSYICVWKHTNWEKQLIHVFVSVQITHDISWSESVTLQHLD